MAIVAVYKFRANFPAAASDAPAPAPAAESREGLLLLRQESDTRADADAVAACASHGALDAVIERYSALDAASLKKPQNRDFVPLHAQALRDGSAIISYVIAAPSAPQSGLH